MQTFELLDRLELISPNNTFFTDLRKTILNNDQFALFRLLQQQTSSQLVEGLRKYKDNTEFNADCFSRGQLESKLWLVKELQKTKVDLGTVFLCAGWYATLATMLFESSIIVDKIRSFDIDDTCRDIAETFNKPWVKDNWKFKSSTKDIMDINYEFERYEVIRADGTTCPLDDTPDTIINTSCEHIENFEEWYAKIPAGKLVILQSNNFFEVDEHVNCVSSIKEFTTMAPMDNILYSGELDLPKYKRFMLIGHK
tara:strand:- start:3309 stop:4070 length:762 start_codon:yes stop_codon:yes gene_type:complete